MSRVLVWGLVIVMVLVAALLASRSARAVAPPTAVATLGDAELARCQRLGEPAGQDKRCRQAWDRAHDRFFGAAR